MKDTFRAYFIQGGRDNVIEINEAVRAFIDKAAGNVGLSEDEYIDHSDGLIHCKKCGGKRQTILPDL